MEIDHPLTRRMGLWVALMLLFASIAWAAPQVTPIGSDLYAYISDNDASANSTFLVANKGILVVDTGLNVTEGDRLLREIRKISPLPVLYVINTHYHPDHQGGNSVVGPSATVVSTDFTRERTLAMMQSEPQFHFAPADLTSAIERLLADHSLHDRMATIAGRLQANPGTATAADLIERLPA